MDDFFRADEGPPPSAFWSGGFLQGDTLKVISNVCGATTANGDARWNQSNFGPDCECFVSLATVANFYLVVRGSGSLSTFNGYVAYYTSGGLTQLYRYDGGVGTALGAALSFGLSAGDGFGLEAVGDQISVYSCVSGVWALQGSRTDAVYAGMGFIGIGVDSSTTRFSASGGGSIAGSGPQPDAPTMNVVRKSDLVLST